MIRHSIQIALFTLVGVTGIFLPFIPGDYDHAAVSISSMAQLFAFSGLLLVPAGIFWLAYESRKQKKASARSKYVLTAWLLGIPVALATSLGAFISHSRFLACAVLLICAVLFFRNILAMRRMQQGDSTAFSASPLYLIIIPLILCCSRLLFIEQAAAYSRNRVIRNSEALIRDIEEYKRRTGAYPSSLISLWEDYKPGIVSVQRYHYEPSGKSYNLYFEQFSPQPGTREIVMYNPEDRQEMTSHNQDLLRLDTADLERQRGYFDVEPLPQKHWKVFRFD